MQRPRLRAMTSDLRNRLLMLLVLPLMALATVGVWLDYRSADEAAGRHDLRLLRTERCDEHHIRLRLTHLGSDARKLLGGARHLQRLRWYGLHGKAGFGVGQ